MLAPGSSCTVTTRRVVAAFERWLRNTAWNPGKTIIIIEFCFADGSSDRFVVLAAQLTC